MTKAAGPKRTTPGTAAGVSPFTLPFAPFAPFASGNGAGLEAWAEISQSMISKYTEMHQEAVRFMARRFEEDSKYQRELAACKSPSEAADVLSSFAKSLMADYAEEARRFTDALGEAGDVYARLGSLAPPLATPAREETAAQRMADKV